tara:strand:- start:22402 stop:23598 length:1197 start_codon:yes stop_codon:yes gene_type:complete
MKKISYPLLKDAFSKSDLMAAQKVIKSGQLTMSKVTKKFELEFAKKIGSKYALMVNSGSSANLLATFAACNPYRKNIFKRGDEAILPSLCWSTSLWPLVQAGLKPVFVDVNPETLNVDVKDIIKNITKKTKLIMAVHVLGGCTDMKKLIQITKKKKIILIEDTCESLGSTFNKKKLGTFGDFGTYSFYYSHQISSAEGGMVVCNNYNDYSILHSLRSHGWTRNLKVEKKFNKFDKRFIFYNMGFNLRPTDITASIGFNQLKRLKTFQKQRDQNRKKILDAIKHSKLWKNQFSFQKIHEKCDPSWFGLPIMINKKYSKSKNKFIDYLEKSGIETRPIISGNFVNQPAIKKFNLNKKNKKFPNAQIIEDTGFFIGLHTKKITTKEVNYLTSRLFKIEEFN